MTAIDKHVVQFILNASAQERAKLEREHAEYVKYTAHHRKEAENYVEYAKQKQAQIKELEEEEKKGGNARREAAETMAAQLVRHAGVHSMTVNGEGLVITTPLLFANIRLKEGSRRKKRACIGAFEIRFQQNSLPRVTNLVFNQHWAIRDQRFCLGEYEEDVLNALDKKDFYGAFDILFHLLHSAGEDAAAYTQSHQWRDDYRTGSDLGQHALPERAVAIQKGSYVVMAHDGYESVRGIKGYVGVVEKVVDNPPMAHVVFKEHVHGHIGCTTSFDGHCWYVPPSLLIPITKEEYEKANVYKIVSTTGMLDMVDALPDGSTVDDLQKLFKSLEKTPLTATLEEIKTTQ